MADLTFFATCPKGMEELLADELRALGAGRARAQRAGVSWRGPPESAYSACLWSRLASRVLLHLTDFRAADARRLYDGVQRLDWSEHLDPAGTLTVDVTAAHPPADLRHSHFVAQKVKDAIVDQFRERRGERPSVDVRRPDVRVNVHLAGEAATLSLDLSGESLHRRGYRKEGRQVEAPLKENLAAAVLVRTGWPQLGGRGGSPPTLVDPLCGSGTLLIEGAWMAADIAPGLLRAESGAFGFLRWKQHDAAAWDALVGEARERRAAGLARLRAARAHAGGAPLIVGYDRDPRALELARACIERAGLAGVVEAERRELAALTPPARAAAPGFPPGLVVTNPPYGERLRGTAAETVALYATLGERLRAGFAGWRAAILVGDRSLGHLLGLRAVKLNTLWNGAIKVTLLQFEISQPAEAARETVDRTEDGSSSSRAHQREAADRREIAGRQGAGRREVARPRGERATTTPPEGDVSSGGAHARAAADVDEFANRLRKNARHFGRTMRRRGVTCYRIYDADLPDYALAIDLYEEVGREQGRGAAHRGGQASRPSTDRDARLLHAHVQEYAAPPEIDPAKAQARLRAALRVIPEVLAVPPTNVHLKVRQRQRGPAQYGRQAAQGDFLEVREGELRFLVNLTDFLDTGLFLDGRLTRRLIAETARGARFLNLFCYTGAASVAAGKGSAAGTTSVDLSRTYLDWARRNLDLNGLRSDRNLLLQADVLEWIGRPQDGSHEAPEHYDLIYLDPPTFSNSKRMGRATFDVARDHADLIRVVARRLLHPGGTLLFAGNARRFRMEVESLTSSGLDLHDLSAATLAPDFARSARTHHLWRITQAG